MLWIRFIEIDTNIGPGITIIFSDPPLYAIGYCKSMAEFEVSMPNASASGYRIWTFKKQGNKTDLFCNGIKMFDLNLDVYPYSNNENCKDRWSRNFARIKFVHQPNDPDQPGDPPRLTDTASDYMRQYEGGKLLS